MESLKGKFNRSVDQLFSCGLERCQIEQVLYRFIEKLCTMEESGEVCFDKASDEIIKEMECVRDRK